MADVTADMVKELREKTGARMMDCKKALDQTKAEYADKGRGPWMDAGEKFIRITTQAKGGEMKEKAASEGLLGMKRSADGKAVTIVEMTATTDFVAKNDQFLKLLQQLVDLSDTGKIDSAEKLNAASLNGTLVAEVVKAMAGNIGENISVKRVERFEGEVGCYIHFDNKQGALVELGGVSGQAAIDLGKELCMHIVAAVPVPSYLTREEVPADLLSKEKEIISERLKNDPKNAGKPPQILEKIVTGQLGKFYGEHVLPDQLYAMDNSKTVSQVLKDRGNATIKRFARFQVGV